MRRPHRRVGRISLQCARVQREDATGEGRQQIRTVRSAAQAHLEISLTMRHRGREEKERSGERGV